MQSTPDIDLLFLFRVQGTCVDTTVLFIGMFWYFMDKIACNVTSRSLTRIRIMSSMPQTQRWFL